MYNIPYFKEKDQQVILEFMRHHSFAMLIGCIGNIPVATQVPFLIEEKEEKLFLKGHIMRNTDHHKALVQNNEVLCLFTGAHTYVSARLYNNQQSASTWNYMTVHAKGKINFLDEEALIHILHQTTDHYENDSASPSNFDNLPKEYVAKLINAIVAFEIEVSSVENVFKLSQNKKKEEYDRITTHLEGNEEGKELANEMQKRRPHLFS